MRSELAQVMEGFGYGILKALVTDIEPDARVKESMNEINAAQRMRVAATEKGEADRILKVKAAEDDAQSKALQGRGIADQRHTIVAGLRDSVDVTAGAPLRGLLETVDSVGARSSRRGRAGREWRPLPLCGQRRRGRPEPCPAPALMVR